MSAAGYSRIFVTLLHEGTLAAELVSAGVTVLRTATTPRSGLYELALFNLSIGFERMCKTCRPYRPLHREQRRLPDK